MASGRHFVGRNEEDIMDTSNSIENITVTLDGSTIGTWVSQGNSFLATEVISTSNTFPSIPDVCAMAHCLEHANPANALVANLDIFGSPEVQVWFCDNHYRLFAGNTDEHTVPDIQIDEELF